MLGCIVPGGGGSQQTLPEVIRAGEPAVIQYDLMAHDLPWSRGRFRDVTLFYRLVGDSVYRSVRPSSRKRVDRAREAYEFRIPAYPSGTEGEVELYFTNTFDGHPNRTPGWKKIPVR
jgi:hypothetical protein